MLMMMVVVGIMMMTLCCWLSQVLPSKAGLALVSQDGPEAFEMAARLGDEDGHDGLVDEGDLVTDALHALIVSSRIMIVTVHHRPSALAYDRCLLMCGMTAHRGSPRNLSSFRPTGWPWWL